MNLESTPLNDILLFVSVVEAEGFSRAAKKLSLDVSSLSKRIIRLEKNLKTQLLQRTTRQMTLTESGEVLYQYARQIKQQLQDLQSNITKLNHTPSGKLKISTPHSLGSTHLIGAVRDFLALYPEIHCELILGNQTKNPIHDNVDVLISIKPLEDVNLIAKKIADRTTGIYASPSYLKKYGIPKAPQDLLKHNCLMHLDRSEKNFWTFDVDGVSEHIPVKGNFCANSNAALLSAATAGLGLAKLPSFMADGQIQSKKLVSVLSPFRPEPTPVYAIYAKHRVLPQKIKLFVDFLTQHFANLLKQQS